MWSQNGMDRSWRLGMIPGDKGVPRSSERAATSLMAQAMGK